jgi:hypothetical protein
MNTECLVLLVSLIIATAAVLLSLPYYQHLVSRVLTAANPTALCPMPRSLS